MKKILIKTSVPNRLKDYIIELNIENNKIIKTISESFLILDNEKEISKVLIDRIEKSDFLKRYIDKILFLEDETNDINDILKFLNESVYKLDVLPKNKEFEYINFFDKNNIKLHPTQYDKVLYIYDKLNVIYFGIKENNINDKLIFNDKHISRAYYKIVEIFERLNYDKKLNNVLDIGAAPGGWSEYFVKITDKVIAVDPAEMLIDNENLLHIKGKFEDNYQEIEKYAPFDLIACDMNQDPKEVSNYLNYFSKYLKKGGMLIYTLKLVYKGRVKSEKLIIDSKELLTNFDDKKIYWLMSNRQYERTLVACKGYKDSFC